jgi:hypothetical protein
VRTRAPAAAPHVELCAAQRGENKKSKREGETTTISKQFNNKTINSSNVFVFHCFTNRGFGKVDEI